MHKLKLLPYIIRYSISARDKKRMDSTGPYNMCNKLCFNQHIPQYCHYYSIPTLWPDHKTNSGVCQRVLISLAEIQDPQMWLDPSQTSPEWAFAAKSISLRL